MTRIFRDAWGCCETGHAMRIAGADDVGQRISRDCSLSRRRERAYSYPLSTAPSLAAAIAFDPTSASLWLVADRRDGSGRSEEHTSELQSLMRISYAVFCLKKKKKKE